ncbi:MAG: ParB/RepB/Spo0J family partition protein [Gammaproteobacteria bacterium]
MTLKPELRTIPLHQLLQGAYQPRKRFSDAELQELAQSILNAGLLQPIVVRPHKLQSQHFEIIAGERRWRAAQLAGLEAIPCLINQFTDEQAAEAATVENINRVNLNPLEEAQAYQRMIDEFGYLHEEIAATVGKSRTRISNMLRLLHLDERVKHLLEEGKLTEGHGKALAGAPKEIQWHMAEKAVKHQWSVRKIEKTIQASLRPHKTVNTLNDPNLASLTHALSDYVGSGVNIEYDIISGKGQLSIDFQNLEVLQGIFQKMQFDYNTIETK